MDASTSFEDFRNIFSGILYYISDFSFNEETAEPVTEKKLDDTKSKAGVSCQKFWFKFYDRLIVLILVRGSRTCSDFLRCVEMCNPSIYITGTRNLMDARAAFPKSIKLQPPLYKQVFPLVFPSLSLSLSYSLTHSIKFFSNRDYMQTLASPNGAHERQQFSPSRLVKQDRWILRKRMFPWNAPGIWIISSILFSRCT